MFFKFAEIKAYKWVKFAELYDKKNPKKTMKKNFRK